MFAHILSKLPLFGSTPSNDFIETQRSDMRHEGMKVEVVVGRRAYPVHDWSRGGVSFQTPDHGWNIGGVYYETYEVPKLQAGDALKITLRFHLLQGAVEIPVDAQILRVEGGATVAQLSPLSKNATRKFDGVIDSFNAERFLETQITSNGV